MFYGDVFLQYEELGFSPLHVPSEILSARGEVKNVSNCASWCHLASDFPPVGYHDFVAFMIASENMDIFNKLLYVYYHYVTCTCIYLYMYTLNHKKT